MYALNTHGSGAFVVVRDGLLYNDAYPKIQVWNLTSDGHEQITNYGNDLLSIQVLQGMTVSQDYLFACVYGQNRFLRVDV